MVLENKIFSGVFSDNVDLGTACGKYFRVSCLSIIDPGTTNFFSCIKPGLHK